MVVIGDTYFKMKQIDLTDIHYTLSQMALVFHDICHDNRIPYYMLGGTMLGAVRHKGFIPWDDDMDFGIPREHYQRFLEICQKDLPDHIKLLYYDNSDYAILGFAKLSDSRTVVKEEFAPITDEVLGINIDVFPLDHANGKRSIFSKNIFIRLAFKLQKLLFFNPQNRPTGKRILAKLTQFVCRLDKKTIPGWLDRHLSKVSNSKELNMYANYFGAWGLKELVSKDVFGTPTLYEFEGTKLYGVQNADAYLKSLYGDYHIIPDESKRHVHSFDAFYLGNKNDSAIFIRKRIP